jgi:hypothetical protein
MKSEHLLVIEWSILDEQWEKAKAVLVENGRGSAYDRGALARYYLLYGDVDFAYEGSRLYGDTYGVKGINVSFFDLVIAFADALLAERFAPGRSMTYEQLDDDLRIQFAAEGEAVRIMASDRPDAFLVPRAAFVRGVVVFLCAVGNALTERLSAAMDWQSMASLKEVMVRHSSKGSELT